MNQELILYILIGVSAVLLCLLIFALVSIYRQKDSLTEIRLSNKDAQEELSEMRRDNQLMVQTLQNSFQTFGQMISNNQIQSSETQDKRLADLNSRFSNMAVENEMKLENIRETMEKRLSELTSDNNKQLEQMRLTVDEKLQTTLETRISQSFKLVSERLEQVYSGLGEMKVLANSVGDLKKVISNVKTRGVLGEFQLEQILDQILAKDQYGKNVQTKPATSERVEFAVKLPGGTDKLNEKLGAFSNRGESMVWLPIDSKFPSDKYGALMDAYESGNPQLIREKSKQLEDAIKSEAKRIRDKYINPPYTTDFAIMFLPFEGLYAEVVRMGMIEILQKEYNINIAGPTTMAALLNSLQMGFRTLAIQKHSSEVWEVLGSVKTEFDKFGDVLIKAQSKLNQANTDLDTLIGVRTRSIQRSLRSVTALGEKASLTKAEALSGTTLDKEIESSFGRQLGDDFDEDGM